MKQDTKKTSLQVRVITLKDYIDSNAELSKDVPGNSMTFEDYINMELGQISDEYRITNFEIKLTDCPNNQTPRNSQSKIAAIIHYLR